MVHICNPSPSTAKAKWKVGTRACIHNSTTEKMRDPTFNTKLTERKINKPVYKLIFLVLIQNFNASSLLYFYPLINSNLINPISSRAKTSTKYGDFTSERVFLLLLSWFRH